MNNNPLKIQIAGEYYKSEFQPVELFAKLSLNAFQANIVKYVCRYKHKNGAEDLRKAIHYCELAQELKPKSYSLFQNDVNKVLKRFSKTNILNEAQEFIILETVWNNYEMVKLQIQTLLLKEYGV